MLMNEVKLFGELPIAKLLKDNLERAQFISTTPVQGRALIPALEGRDILGTAKTGSGKTLAFLLPIINRLMENSGREIEALILVPTRELAAQIMDTLKLVGANSGIPVALVVGGLSEFKQLNAIKRGARIVIATPGRLNDYLKRKAVSLKSVKILVLDEADRMVDMGFLPQMRAIMNHVPQDRQSMCFSATLDKTVAHLVHDYLKNPARIEIDSLTRPAESVVLRMFEVVKEQKLYLLIYMLQTEPGTFLVFTRTKHGADKLFRKLVYSGFDAAVLHGGKSQSQRTRALGGFKEGKHRVLIATDIAARGIHIDKIGHVVNYDLPQNAEDFIHRAGRTGRVKESGVAVTFVTPEDSYDIRTIERLLGKKIERLPLPNGLESEPKFSSGQPYRQESRARTPFRGRRSFRPRRRY